MKVIDWKKFACFDYVNGAGSSQNPYSLGDVVFNPRTNEIGVVIWIHDQTIIRTDMFGNTSVYDVVLAEKKEIEDFRSSLLNHLL